MEGVIFTFIIFTVYMKENEIINESFPSASLITMSRRNMESVGTAASIHQVFAAIFSSLCSHFVFSGQREMKLLQSLEMLANTL